MVEALGVLVPISLIAGVFLSIYFYLKARTRERMAMIEKGIYEPNKPATGFQTLKWGLVCIGVAVGLFAGNLLKNLTSIEEEVAYFSMVLLFGGLALITGHIIQMRIRKSDNNG